MNNTIKQILKKIINSEKFKVEDILYLLNTEGADKEDLFNYSQKIRERLHGNNVYVRGVIELSNFCSCLCKFCGNSASAKIERYRMMEVHILECIKVAQENNIDMIHLASGNDIIIDDIFLKNIISYCKNHNLKVELAIGNKSTYIYKKLFELGAKRYIMKFETSNKNLFSKIKLCGKSFNEYLNELEILKHAGFQVGSGNIIGLPGQNIRDIANDIILLSKLKLDMISTSVFIPNKDSEYNIYPKGNAEVALKYLAIINIINSTKKISIPTNSTLGIENKINALSIASNEMSLNLTSELYKNKYSIYTGRDRFKADIGVIDDYIRKANKKRVNYKEFISYE
ncbi:biotin synthase BioB [Clostridium estertheticum]|uniref:biotin synthase BioB n=1 Tax=Clostridium estertheticum TaxID=238834 RepID=UPI00124CE741|nr:radical SAM protein [Clostridium estertheticum]MBZ9618255.1 radical SAM protein [Clostridium estertheticum subsp. laramiense]WAG76243.1 radical SAM protein [Clostridium estertheticum]